MSIPLVLTIAVLTYASSAAAFVLLPNPPAGLRRVLDNVPSPLFAGLASLSLVGEAGVWRLRRTLRRSPEPSARFRPLLTLVGGLAGYAVGTWLL